MCVGETSANLESMPGGGNAPPPRRKLKLPCFTLEITPRQGRVGGGSWQGVDQVGSLRLRLEGFSVRVCDFVNPASYVVNSSLCVHMCVN